MTRAAALTAVGAGQAFGRRRQDRDGRGGGIDGDRREGNREGGGRGDRLRARGVEAGEVDQCVCGLC